MRFGGIFSGDYADLSMSAITSYWLFDLMLWLTTALLLGGSVLLAINLVRVSVQESSNLRKKLSRWQIALFVITLAAFGVIDALYWQFIVDGALDNINIIHWFSFIGAFISIVFFYYRIKYQEQQIDKQTNQIQLQIEKEIDDKFHSAIQLLGNSHMSTRIGAIYILYQLAIKSGKYRQEVAQILCSHIKTKTQEQDYPREQYKFKPSIEIQTTINLLFREENGIKGLYKNPEIFYSLANADLSYSYLVGADFKWADCRYVNFEGANCQHAEFVDAKCQGTSFVDAKCQAALFVCAKLQSANFFRARCQGTHFAGTECQGADFVQAKCQGAGFIKAECHGANFSEAGCQGAIFDDAKLQGANFDEAGCQGAEFSSANFRGACTTKGMLNAVAKKCNRVADLLLNRIGQSTELETMIISGGLDAETIKAIEEAHSFLNYAPHSKLPAIINVNKEKKKCYAKPSGVEAGVLEDSEEIREIIAVLENIEKVRYEWNK